MSSFVAAASPIVMQSLKDLHPVDADMPYQLSEIRFPSIVVTVTQVEESIRSFPKGSAGGRDGLRPQHLMDILQCPLSRSRDLYLKRLTAYVNISLAGKLPASIATFITSAPVYPLIKNGGGVRPIAVGEVLRRLTSKLASSAVRHTAVEHLSPLQVGVGIKNGTEAIIHAVNNLLSNEEYCRNNVLLKVDLSNAFNRISRATIFQEVQNICPLLSPWVEYCYSTSPLLFVENETILSSAGVQQGDPLGPLLFALALQPLLRRIRDSCPNLKLNAWYLDDGVLVGPSEEVNLALEIISSVGPSYGAHINLPKCELWSLSEVSSTDIFNPVIPRAVDGTALLGTAVGSDPFIISVVQNCLVKIDDLLSKIRSLEDAQLEYVLLRSCAGLPKFIHVMRTTSPQSLGPTLLEMDSLLEEACRSIMGNCALLDRELDKLRLPISYGGCGVLSALWLAQPAFIASTSQSLVLQSALTVLDIAPRA